MLLSLSLSLSFSLLLSLSLSLSPSLSLSYLFPLSLLPSISWFCILLCVMVSLFLHDQRQSRANGQHARSFDHSLKLTFSPFMISWFFVLPPQVSSLLLPPFVLHFGPFLFPHPLPLPQTIRLISLITAHQQQRHQSVVFAVLRIRRRRRRPCRRHRQRHQRHPTVVSTVLRRRHRRRRPCRRRRHRQRHPLWHIGSVVRQRLRRRRLRLRRR